MNDWEKLLSFAQRLESEHLLSKELEGELALILAGIECEQITGGMIGNLVDDSKITPMWRCVLEFTDKDAIVQSAWELYATYVERVLAKREGENGNMQVIATRLKFDAFMRTLDRLVDERIAGIWRELKSG